jgi:hypothetical protein
MEQEMYWSKYAEMITEIKVDEMKDCSRRIAEKYIGLISGKKKVYKRIGMIAKKFDLAAYMRVARIRPKAN